MGSPYRVKKFWVSIILVAGFLGGCYKDVLYMPGEVSTLETAMIVTSPLTTATGTTQGYFPFADTLLDYQKSVANYRISRWQTLLQSGNKKALDEFVSMNATEIGWVEDKFWIRREDQESFEKAKAKYALFLKRTKQPADANKRHRLQVDVRPQDSDIRLVNPDRAYEPGMLLPPGEYRIKVTKEGYLSEERSTKIEDQDVTIEIDLKP
jgi:hypothetical protein